MVKTMFELKSIDMPNNIDSQVDETLEKCILATPRNSFFSLLVLAQEKHILWCPY